MKFNIKFKWKPMALIAHEKHGNRIFLVKDAKSLDKVCKQLFKERVAEGWYNMQDLDAREKRMINDKIDRLKSILNNRSLIAWQRITPSDRMLLKKAENPKRIFAGEEWFVDHHLVEMLENSLKSEESYLKANAEENFFVTEFKKIIKKLIVDPRGFPMSYNLLRTRNDHEYERLSLETFS